MTRATSLKDSISNKKARLGQRKKERKGMWGKRVGKTVKTELGGLNWVSQLHAALLVGRLPRLVHLLHRAEEQHFGRVSILVGVRTSQNVLVL